MDETPMDETSVRALSVLILLSRYVVMNDDVYAAWLKWVGEVTGEQSPVELREGQAFAAAAIMEWSAIQDALKGQF
jgi:hypothetical protein